MARRAGQRASGYSCVPLCSFAIFRACCCVSPSATTAPDSVLMKWPPMSRRSTIHRSTPARVAAGAAPRSRPYRLQNAPC